MTAGESAAPAPAGDIRDTGVAVRAALGVGIAVSAYGISFGALAVASGLEIWQACVMKQS